MRTELDEMNLTAYAVGELEGLARESVERRLAENPADRQFVEETRAAAKLISDELVRQDDPGLDAIHLAAIECRLHDRRFAHRINRRAIIHARIGLVATVAASIAIIAGIGGLAVLMESQHHELANSTPAAKTTVPTVLIPLIDSNVEAVSVGEPIQFPSSADGFVNSADRPISSFAMDADSSSYEQVRIALLNGHLPSPQSVHVQGLINAFEYGCPAPPKNGDFAGQIEIGNCPWRKDSQLARISVRAGLGAPVIAQNATAQVAFNSRAVKSYRLIGYEDRTGKAPAGEEISAGHRVTALYEFIPAHVEKPLNDLMTLSIRYHRPGSQAEQVATFLATSSSGGNPSPDFRFTAAVAEFGMVLRESPHGSGPNLDSAIALAESARRTDPRGERQEFIELVRRAKQIMG